MNHFTIALLATIGLLLGCESKQPRARELQANAAVHEDNIEHYDPAQDVMLVGGPLWIAYPQGTMPQDEFLLCRYEAQRPSGQRQAVHISQISASTDSATGTAEELIQAVGQHPHLIQGMRIIEGGSFDEYPAVLRLKRDLSNAGWREVPNRPGLGRRSG